MLELFLFFKQKTAYEMRISDWSSDVCSSDLRGVDTLEVKERYAPTHDLHSLEQICGGERIGSNEGLCLLLAIQVHQHQAADDRRLFVIPKAPTRDHLGHIGFKILQMTLSHPIPHMFMVGFVVGGDHISHVFFSV